MREAESEREREKERGIDGMFWVGQLAYLFFFCSLLLPFLSLYAGQGSGRL